MTWAGAPALSDWEEIKHALFTDGCIARHLITQRLERRVKYTKCIFFLFCFAVNVQLCVNFHRDLCLKFEIISQTFSLWFMNLHQATVPYLLFTAVWEGSCSKLWRLLPEAFMFTGRTRGKKNTLMITQQIT